METALLAAGILLAIVVMRAAPAEAAGRGLPAEPSPDVSAATSETTLDPVRLDAVEGFLEEAALGFTVGAEILADPSRPAEEQLVAGVGIAVVAGPVGIAAAAVGALLSDPEALQAALTLPSADDLSIEHVWEHLTGGHGGELYSEAEREQALRDIQEYEEALWGPGGYDPSTDIVRRLSDSPSVEYWAQLWWVESFKKAWGRWPVDYDEYLDWYFQRIAPV